VVFLVCLCFFVIGIVGLPVLYNAYFPIQVVKYILMGVLVLVLIVVAVCGAIFFKEAFI